MNRNFMTVTLLVFTLIFSMLTAEAYAREYGKTEGHYEGLDNRFSHKARFVLQNQEELGLSDKQVKEIRDLVLKARKDLVTKEAEIEVLAWPAPNGACSLSLRVVKPDNPLYWRKE